MLRLITAMSHNLARQTLPVYNPFLMKRFVYIRLCSIVVLCIANARIHDTLYFALKIYYYQQHYGFFGVFQLNSNIFRLNLSDFRSNLLELIPCNFQPCSSLKEVKRQKFHFPVVFFKYCSYICSVNIVYSILAGSLNLYIYRYHY